MSDSEDDRQQQGSNEQRQRQQQREESDMRGGEVRAGSRSYAVEIPKRFGPNPPTGGAKCDPHRVVIAQWACSGLGARVEKVGPVQWHWIQTLVPLSQFQSPLLLSRSTTRRSASGLRATTMCTACISLLASTSVSGAATGASMAIASSYSGTRRGQGLSGVGTRNPDGLWYIERVRAMERNIKINKARERKRESGI